MNKQQAPLFTWVGSGNPNDPSGVARFVVGHESVTVAMRSFREAYSLSRLIEKACDRTKPAKGSAKPNQFWPFDEDETAMIQQGQPPLTRSQLNLIETSGMKADAMRLRYLMDNEVLDGFAHVEPDRYECASQCAEMAGREEPNEDDELNGFRLLIDMAIHADSAAKRKKLSPS